MKLGIALLLLVSTSLAQLTDEGLKATPEDQIKAMKAHANRLRGVVAIEELDAAENQNRFLTEKLVEVQRANEDARRLAAQSEKDMAALREWGNEQAEIATKAMGERDEAKKLAAHRGNLLGWICAAAGMFAGASLIRFIPPPYNLAILPLMVGGGFAIGRFLL